VADEIPYDECEGNEDYIDVSGGELRKLLSSHTPRNLPAAMGLDTEGSIIDNAPANPWAVQISTAPGTAYVLRCEREDFSVGIATIQQLVDWGVVVVMHNAMFDVEMSRLMGLQLSHPAARIYDTQYGAYVTRHEPQALKALARRRCGMEMASYEDTVGDAGLDKQLAYLWAVAEGAWPKPEAQLVMSNDGTARVYQPQTIQRTAERILSDWYAEVRNTKGARADLFKRWYGIGSTKQVGRVLRGPVEGELGRMPIGTLADIPLTRAVEYAGRDADAALRVYEYQVPALREADLLRTVDDGMSVLPVFEEMQAGGIPALRSHFVKLAAEMNEEMAVYQSRISSRYCGNRPFNPKSNKDVGALIRRRGLVPKKRTATGAVSTSKDSIEYLRYTDPAISDVFEWRERQHTRDTFALPTVERIPEAVGAGASASVGVDGIPYAVRSRLKVTRTATRRLAAADPNVLAITTHGDLGRRIKEGYVCPDGELFGAWDLSGIEMRYMAHESGDSAMCGVFRRGDDIHDNTASYIFDLPIEELDKRKHRVPAKRTGFGINYGQGPHGLATKLLSLGLTGWTVEACEGLIDGYLSVYPDVDRYMRDTRDELAAAGGRVVDYWGMPRELPGISHPEPKVRSEAGRIAVSHKIQGGAQGMIQRSMAWLRPRIWDMQQAGWNVRWVLQVHDELLLRFDEGLAEVVGELVLEALTEHAGIELCVPVEADGAVSKTWAGLKG
jgi:DNA polymerase I-like protein with 3'-5' exonuclease and polymerase domains